MHVWRDISGKFSYFIMKLYVVGTHWNRLTEAVLMSTLNMPLINIKSPNTSLNNLHLPPNLAL